MGDPLRAARRRRHCHLGSERLGQRSNFWLAVIHAAQSEDFLEEMSIPRIRITAELRPNACAIEGDVAVMNTPQSVRPHPHSVVRIIVDSPRR